MSSCTHPTGVHLLPSDVSQSATCFECGYVRPDGPDGKPTKLVLSRRKVYRDGKVYDVATPGVFVGESPGAETAWDRIGRIAREGRSQYRARIPTTAAKPLSAEELRELEWAQRAAAEAYAKQAPEGMAIRGDHFELEDTGELAIDDWPENHDPVYDPKMRQAGDDS